MEFWNSLLTEKSWRILQELRKQYQFILIGGWAIYLWTKHQKSKDIDIVVEIQELQKLKQERLIKNDRLLKYEIKREEVDVDIYVAHYSKLAIPAEELRRYSTSVEGFQVLLPEALVILKQGAFLERKDSLKGEKDMFDILSLLFFTSFDYERYFSLLRRYKLEHYLDSLLSVVSGFQDYARFSFTPRELKVRKKDILNRLKKLGR